MKVLGVVAEFNPLHTGHAYFLQQAKAVSDCDYTIVVMSGQFVQRGEPAIIDKYIRTEMALNNGADLVIEIPALAASGSASYFARTAISILAHTGIVTHLGFGSESGSIQELQAAANILYTESPEFQDIFKMYLKKGMNYPTARALALARIFPDHSSEIFQSPNNILGLEYLLALKAYDSDIHPMTISRCGSAYHDPELINDMPSATALRKNILGQWPIIELSTGHIPSSCHSLLENYFSLYRPVCFKDFSALMHYILLNHSEFEQYMDISSDLSHRILNMRNQFTDIESFIQLLKSKNYTYTAVSRALCHLLLNHTRDDLERLSNLKFAPYIRILGFKSSAARLMKNLKQHSEIPVITKPANAQRSLHRDALRIFNQDVYAARIYDIVRQRECHFKLVDELQHSPMIL